MDVDEDVRRTRHERMARCECHSAGGSMGGQVCTPHSWRASRLHYSWWHICCLSRSPNMCSLVRIVSRRIGLGPPLNGLKFGASILESSRPQWTDHRFSSSQPSPQLIFDKVNGLISSNNLGQTFAVVHVYGKEFLVHLGDIICLEKAIPVEIGEKIKLEKCLLVGNKDFSLVGRPVLNRDLVQVEATVIEKTMSQTYFNMYAIPRNRGYRRYRFRRNPQCMLRINEITVCHPLNSTQQRINWSIGGEKPGSSSEPLVCLSSKSTL